MAERHKSAQEKKSRMKLRRRILEILNLVHVGRDELRDDWLALELLEQMIQSLGDVLCCLRQRHGFGILMSDGSNVASSVVSMLMFVVPTGGVTSSISKTVTSTTPDTVRHSALN